MDRISFARRQGWIAALVKPAGVTAIRWCLDSNPYDWNRWPAWYQSWVYGYWSYFFVDSPERPG
jgi:hypothetical protein